MQWDEEGGIYNTCTVIEEYGGSAVWMGYIGTGGGWEVQGNMGEGGGELKWGGE